MDGHNVSFCMPYTHNKIQELESYNLDLLGKGPVSTPLFEAILCSHRHTLKPTDTHTYTDTPTQILTHTPTHTHTHTHRKNILKTQTQTHIHIHAHFHDTIDSRKQEAIT